MRYVIEQFWVWMLVAAALGLTTGWVSHRQRADASARWLHAYIALVGAGAGIAYSGLVGGMTGLWFETLVVFGVAYLAGCIVGTLVSQMAMPAQRENTTPPA